MYYSSFFAAAAVLRLSAASPVQPAAYKPATTSEPSTTTYACNPAHDYGNGAKCEEQGGSLTLVYPSTTEAATTSYACNPAHDYGNGAGCEEHAGSLTLVYPTTKPEKSPYKGWTDGDGHGGTATPYPTTSYACNPAHDYGNGAKCEEHGGSLTLVYPSTNPETKKPETTTYACNPAHNYGNGTKCEEHGGSLTLVYPSTNPETKKPETTTYACNPAHNYGNGTKCEEHGGSVTLVYPSTKHETKPMTMQPQPSVYKPMTPEPYTPKPYTPKPNKPTGEAPKPTMEAPEPSLYQPTQEVPKGPGGVVCETYVTKTETVTVTETSPAKNYPGGGTEYTAHTPDQPKPTPDQPKYTNIPVPPKNGGKNNGNGYNNGHNKGNATTTPTKDTGKPGAGKSCPTNIAGPHQTPHLIVPVNSAHPDTAYGASYFASMSAENSTIFNFDIPASDAGKTCSLIFLLPKKADLETSDYTFNGKGGVTCDALAKTATEKTTYGSVSKSAKHVGEVAQVEAGGSYMLGSFACPAGEAVSYEFKSTGGLALEYFQDYNPSPIGAYISSC